MCAELNIQTLFLPPSVFVVQNGPTLYIYNHSECSNRGELEQMLSNIVIFIRNADPWAHSRICT